jgi:hypothetical protein
MKAGILTTEFWLSAITVIGLLVGAFIGTIPANTVALLAPIVTGLYVIARAIVKSSASTVDDAVLEKIKNDILSKIPGFTPPAE